LRGRRWKLFFRLIRGTTPMVLAAFEKKVLTSLRKPTDALVLTECDPHITSKQSAME
jgi:hypothetical protein